MNHSTLVTAQLGQPLRAYALTVEEAGAGEFRWRILEKRGNRSGFESVCHSDAVFPAYDTALATGYGELQRLIGPDLQFGPRQEPVEGRPVFSVSADVLADSARGGTAAVGRTIAAKGVMLARARPVRA
jgi:hypothetical protein